MKPPTERQLAGPPPLSLDGEVLLRNFLGKTVEEAREMCQHGPLVTEDFTYMTEAGLEYYLPAALDYLRSADSAGDFEFAGGLMCSLYCQVQHSGMRGRALALIQSVAEHFDRNRAKYDIGPDDLYDTYLAAIRSAEQ